MRPDLRPFAAAAVVAGAAACSVLIGPEGVVEPALIIFYGDTTPIAAPDTVVAGARFSVAVPTFAGGCTRELASTDVRTVPGGAELRLMNRRRPAAVCPDDLMMITHRAELRLVSPGLQTIRIVGGERGASTGSATRPAQLERRIVVR